MEVNDPYFVPTRSSLKGSSSYTCVVHELSKPTETEDSIVSPLQTKVNSTSGIQDDEKMKRAQNREMKKLRFDVYQFARTGLKAQDKFTADKELAIRLGAARPKRPGKNYLEVKKEREERNKAKALLKADPSASLKVPFDPYKNTFNLKKKMRTDRKKGNIGGMLKDYGKPQLNKIKSNKR